MSQRRIVHIRRRFAVILEDCIETVLPDDIDPTDQEAVDEWATENYTNLSELAVNKRDYGEDAYAFDHIEIDEGTGFLFEDEHYADIDNIDDEFIVDVI